MRFSRITIADAWVVDIEAVEDERGFFARTWCEREFTQHGLVSRYAQSGISYNRLRGTLRGMHYQAAPHEEAKLVRCTAGAVHDVIVDLRADSPTFRRWAATTLTARNHRMLYIPKGCAHGFQTLEDDTEVLYQISEPYRADASRGCRWDDPAFGIEWPATPRIISQRDRSFTDFGR